MAKFRNVAVKFWSDPYIKSLSKEERLFFLYLITNEHTTQCGIYEIDLDTIVGETKLELNVIKVALSRFESDGKIKFSEKTSELAVKNFPKYNFQGSPKVKVFIDKELSEVKSKELIGYVYGMRTLSQEKEKEKEKEKQSQEEIRYGMDTVSEEMGEIFSGDLKFFWKRWLSHLKGKKIKLSAETLKEQVNFLKARPPDEAIEIIQNSITHGYTGLIEPKKTSHGTTNAKNQHVSSLVAGYNARHGKDTP